MHPNIQSALKHLQNANLTGYFEEMDKVVPDAMRHTFNTHKGVFIAGQAPWNFHQQLEVFAGEVNKGLVSPAAIQNPVVSTPKNYKLPNIRKLLVEGLSDTDLMTLCQDYFPEVYNAFGDSQSRAQKVNALLDYCKRRLKFEELLHQLEAQYPEQYALHKPYRE